jgi:hypothetical protein
MPKLNTTIDNLELKTNKVTGTIPSDSWTDDQYPSAKALYNAYNELLSNIYPIGCIMTTSTNTNPSAALGGTWKLVDKTLRARQVKLDSTYWDAENADLGVGASGSDSESSCSFGDHGVNLRLRIIPSIDLDDTDGVIMGTLNLEKLGITRLHYATLFDVAHSDGGQSVINYCFDINGTLRVYDVCNTDGSHTMSSGKYFYVNIKEEIPHTLMIDSYCDKFYWERTA